jgi:hypothetical protein
MAATDELVALTVPVLARLGTFALLIEHSERPPPACMSVLSCRAADVLRLLDARSPPTAATTNAIIWRQHAFRGAHANAAAVATSSMDEMPLTTVVEASAHAVAEVIIAMRRDKLGVPEGLADALGSLLVLYTAGTVGAD